MSTGEILKKELGLEKFRYVRIARAIISAYKILFVWYDSFRPNIPITTTRVIKFPWSTMIWHGTDLLHGSNKIPSFTPPIDIEDYNGELRGALIVTVDLIGKHWIKTDVFSKEFRDDIQRGVRPLTPLISFHFKNLNQLYEYTVEDLRNNATDPHTTSWYKKRKDDGETGSFLKNAIWNDRNVRGVGKEKYTSTLTLTFRTNVTYDPTGLIITKSGREDGRTKQYTVKIQFQSINDWIESRPAFLSLTKGEQVEFMRGIIKFADVKVHSNDPSWLYQGHFENASELEYSLYNFPAGIPHAKGRWALIKTGNKTTPYYSISKHMMEVLLTIPFLAPDICILIREKYGK